MHIIDALVVTLGLDPSKFQKGQKDAQDSLKSTRESATKTAKEMEADGKKAAEFFSKVRNEAIALTAALMGTSGVKNFVGAMVTGDAALGRLSKNVGMSVEELSAWEQMAARSGGTAAGMAGSIKNIAAQLAILDLTGTNDIIDSLLSAGVNTPKFNDHATTMQERLLLISDALKNMPPAEAQVRGASMGLDEGTINLLMLGRTALEKLRVEQEKIGGTTKENAKAAQDLAQAWDKVGQSATNAGRKMYPVLTQSANGLAGLIDLVSNGEFGKVVKNSPPSKRQSNWFDGYLPQSWIDYMTTGQTMQPGVRKVSGKVMDEASMAHAGVPTTQQTLFAELEKSWGLPSGLLYQMWTAESGRGKNMLSPKGARGHFQVMPATQAAYGLKDPNNLNESAAAAAHMMRDLLNHYGGNLPAALAGYNWGSGNLDRNGMANLPAETRAYIAQITSGMGGVGAGGGNSTTTTVNIAKVDVHTKATDANGVADAFSDRVTSVMQSYRSVQ